MVPSAPRSGRAVRPLAFALACVTVFAALVVAAPRGRAAFSDLEVEPGLYTGTSLYVPTETMRIHVRADADDVYDVDIFEWVAPFGPVTSRAMFDDQLIPGSGERLISYTIPTTLEDSFWYWVGVFGPGYFEAGGGNPIAALALERFEVRGYDLTAWTDKPAYLPGDTVTVNWAALNLKDGAPAPAGVGELQAWDDARVSLITPRQHVFNASVSAFSFTIPTTADPDLDGNFRVWFNDTAGDRTGTDSHSFEIDSLGVIVSVGSVYAPGDVVTVDVWTKVTDFPGAPRSFDPAAEDVRVNLTVSDATTGATTAYGASDLVTARDGRVRHVFQLDATPTQATYDVQASATAHDALNAAESASFDVREAPRLAAVLTLDRSNYVSGEDARGAAAVDPAGNHTYQWRVRDTATGNILYAAAGSLASATYAIPSDYTGTMQWDVTVNDGQGNTATDTVFASVAYGYLAMSVSPSEYAGGDSVAVSFGLRSVVMSSPTFYYEVVAAGGSVVQAGTLSAGASGGSFAYRTPDPPASSYTFVVTASQAGRTVVGQIAAAQLARVVLSIGTDRTSYLPGETIRISYSLTAVGPVSLPQSFAFGIALFGAATAGQATTSPTGELTLRVPANTNEGDLLLVVQEIFTGAQAIETVHIGATNPLWTTEVAGIPTFAILLALLVALLIVGFLFLWRRMAGGMGARPS
ncbi:MAG: hypothetical protein ACT4OI_09385, partial [Methanobacteriota archaeon]